MKPLLIITAIAIGSLIGYYLGTIGAGYIITGHL